MICRQGLITLLGLSSLLSACSSLGIPRLPEAGNTINVVLELSSQVDSLGQARLKAFLEQEAREFKSLNPNIRVRFRSISSERLQQDLEYRAGRGLTPDLILLASSRNLLALHQKGYSTPVELSREEKQSFKPWILSSLRYRGKQLGLPLFIVPSMACFDRRQFPVPPQELSEFLNLANGSAIGLGSNLSELNWILSGFGAPLVPEPGGRSNRQSQALQAFQWLHQANLQPHITFVSTEEELRLGMAEGRFRWIPCYSAWIPSLRQSLGANLGIGLLPAGPAAEARPLVSVATWMVGSQSSPRQRQLAKQFVLFTGNAVNQRKMMLKLDSVFPVNPAILLPLNAYPTLSAMKLSLRNSTFPTLEQYQYLQLNANQISLSAQRFLAQAKAPSVVAREVQHLFNHAPAAAAQP